LLFFSIPSISAHNFFGNEHTNLLSSNLAWRADIITPPTFSPLLFDMNGDSIPELIIPNATHIVVINALNGKVLSAYYIGGYVISMAIARSNKTDSIFSIFASVTEYVWKILKIHSNGTIKSVYWLGSWVFPSVITVDLNGDGVCDIITRNRTGFVLAIDGADDSILWQRLIGDDPYVVMYPVVADLDNDKVYEVIIPTSMGTIHVLNGSDGSLIQHYHISALCSSPIIANIDNDENLEVLLMDDYGNLYLLDFVNNSVSLITKLPSKIGYDLSPIVADLDGDSILEAIVGATDGGVYVVRSSDGTLLWSAKTNGSIISNPVVGDLNGDNILDVVVGSTDGCVYIFSGKNGSLLWWFKTNSSISASPVIADIDGDRLNELVVASDDGYVYAFDFKHSGNRVYWPMFRGTPDNIGNQACVDSDLDLLSDYTESIIGSDPRNPDTDNDGLPDWWEFVYGTNVFENDSALDLDNDNLTNYQEFIHGTDPHNNDTDSDCLPDYWEVLNNLDPRNATDAMLDVDDDYLVNWEEYKHGTDPWNPDTDGDGFSDGEEVFQGYNPLDLNSHPPVRSFQKPPVLSYYLWIIGALCIILLSLGYFSVKKLQLRREMHKRALRALFDFMEDERHRVISDTFQENALSHLSLRVAEGIRYYVSTGDDLGAARFGGLSLDEFDDLRISLNIPRVVLYEEEEE